MTTSIKARTIVLSKYECKIAEYIGKIRRDISTRNFRTTRRDWAGEGLVNDIEAAGAEIAVAKLLNIFPDLSPTEGEVPKYDLIKDNFQIDVKSTQNLNGRLLIPFLDESKIYSLVIGTMPRYQVMGFLFGQDIPSVGEWINPGKRECWAVSRYSFVDWEMLH